MSWKLTNLDIYESDSEEDILIMSLKGNHDSKENTIGLYDLLIKFCDNQPESRENWFDLHKYLAIRLINEGSDPRIEIKERNVSKGAYGTSCVLSQFAVFMLQKHLISEEEYHHLNQFIESNEVVKNKLKAALDAQRDLRSSLFKI